MFWILCVLPNGYHHLSLSAWQPSTGAKGFWQLITEKLTPPSSHFVMFPFDSPHKMFFFWRNQAACCVTIPRSSDIVSVNHTGSRFIFAMIVRNGLFRFSPSDSAVAISFSGFSFSSQLDRLI